MIFSQDMLDFEAGLSVCVCGGGGGGELSLIFSPQLVVGNINIVGVLDVAHQLTGGVSVQTPIRLRVPSGESVFQISQLVERPIEKNTKQVQS